MSFDQQATPRGYRATKCRLLSDSEDILYTTPETFLLSRHSGIKGWETIGTGSWIAMGAGSSPDSAKDDMVKVANKYGANALLNIRYSKSTGEEPSENGKGTHYFTIHHYEGIISMVGKKNVNGKYNREDLEGINSRLEEIYNKWLAEAEKRKEMRIYGTGIGIFITLMIILAEIYILALISVVLSFTWALLWDNERIHFKPLEPDLMEHKEI